jgi:GAF domain-containing protein
MSTAALVAISQASQLLLEQGFTEAAVGRTLELVGRALDVDRVYVFERRATGPGGPLLVDQRFEWNAGAAEPQIDNPEMQGFPLRESAPRWVEQLERGEAVLSLTRSAPEPIASVLRAQDIRSILWCPIHQGGQLWGVVGFDDCRQERVWPTLELTVLRTLSRALAGTLRQAPLRASLALARQTLEEVVVQCAPAGRGT